MPREFDHGAGARQGRYPLLGGAIPATRMGRGEVALPELWPTPLDAMHGPRHQFRLREGGDGLADAAHAWLSRHLRGRWSWLEIEREGGRRVDTLVYVEDPVEADAFRVGWSGSVETRGWAAEHNARLARAAYPGPSPAIAASSSGAGGGVSRSRGRA